MRIRRGTMNGLAAVLLFVPAILLASGVLDVWINEQGKDPVLYRDAAYSEGDLEVSFVPLIGSAAEGIMLRVRIGGEDAGERYIGLIARPELPVSTALYQASADWEIAGGPRGSMTIEQGTRQSVSGIRLTPEAAALEFNATIPDAEGP